MGPSRLDASNGPAPRRIGAPASRRSHPVQTGGQADCGAHGLGCPLGGPGGGCRRRCGAGGRFPGHGGARPCHHPAGDPGGDAPALPGRGPGPGPGPPARSPTPAGLRPALLELPVRPRWGRGGCGSRAEAQPGRGGEVGGGRTGNRGRGRPPGAQRYPGDGPPWPHPPIRPSPRLSAPGHRSDGPGAPTPGSPQPGGGRQFCPGARACAGRSGRQPAAGADDPRDWHRRRRRL